jgi:hypothetical protein
MNEALLGDDPTSIGVAATKAKFDKCEEILIAAKSRQDAAYNRYATTLESRNKTVASCVKASAPPSYVIRWGEIQGEREGQQFPKEKTQGARRVERSRG